MSLLVVSALVVGLLLLLLLILRLLLLLLLLPLLLLLRLLRINNANTATVVFYSGRCLPWATACGGSVLAVQASKKYVPSSTRLVGYASRNAGLAVVLTGGADLTNCSSSVINKGGNTSLRFSSRLAAFSP